MQFFPANQQSFLLPGPAGDLEVIATPVDAAITPKNAIAVICHPHPQFGGTMNNKVVTTLARAFGELGLATVRFNFRGVGKSTGAFADGVGEIQDALAIVDWVRKIEPEKNIWLAGFSFGAAVSAHVATIISAQQLVSIAPPVPRFHLLDLPQITCPWLIVQGEEDDVVKPEDVYAWVTTREPQPQLIRIANAGHFFHGQLIVLREKIKDALKHV
jgi:uncharacterized protein